MRRRPPRSTRTDTLFPYTTLFRSLVVGAREHAPRGPFGLPAGDVGRFAAGGARADRSEEHTSELQSLMRISYAVFCLKKKKNKQRIHTNRHEITLYEQTQRQDQNTTAK